MADGSPLSVLRIIERNYRFQVSGVSKQMTDNREQNFDRTLHLADSTICLLSSDLCSLTPET